MFDLSRYSNNIAAILEDGTSCTYAALQRKVDGLSSSLRKGSLAFCLCKNSVGSLVGYLSFLQSSVPAIMLDGDKGAEAIHSLLDIYQPQYMWLPTARVSEFPGVSVVEVEDYTLLKYNVPLHEIHPDVTLMLTTSGSTGSPKLVKLTAKNLLSNAESIAEYLEITSEAVSYTHLRAHET